MPVIFRLLLCALLLLSTNSFAASADPGYLDTVTVVDNIVDLRTTGGQLLRITFLTEDVFRIQATTGDEPEDEDSGKAPIVLDVESFAVTPVIQHHETHQSISTPALELRVQTSPLILELRRIGEERPLWQELKPLTISEGRTVQTLSSSGDEHFLGGGQQNGTFEFKGQLMEISYSGGWEEGDRPSPAPFYMSDQGYGVLRNTWADGVYDFRSENYLTATHTENRFDAYYMVGANIHEVLDHYTWLTGRAGLLPRWAFEYGDADCYNDGDNVDKPGTVPADWTDGPTGTTLDVVAAVAEKYREHDMPGGWILPNDGYGCGYEDLPEVVARLKNLGFHTGLWTENGVEKIAWEIGTAGTRVQKLDVAWTGKGYQWALDANHDAAQGFLENSDSRPFIWTVMGWAGIQRYAVTWTGDQSGSWDYIRWHVPTLIGSGLSGMNYSTGDVDGIFGGSAETFTRDLQWKCFTSVFMGMSGWSKAERKHPWWFDEPYRSINRRYMKLRQRLMPYIYTLARETETTGAPMVRGIMWDHPDDPQAYDHPYQFFLGKNLLVAPVYRSQTASGGWREDIYLPEGSWIDYWHGTTIEAGPAGKLIDIPVDLATLPVFVSAGAIIPMYPESLYDGQVPADPLTLDVYPYESSEFVLYEDDGNTRAYQNGQFSEQRFAVSDSKSTGTVEVTIDAVRGEFDGLFEQRCFVLQLHTRVAPESILLDGGTLPVFTTKGQYEAATLGWFFDSDDRLGVTFIKSGKIDTRQDHSLSVMIDPKIERAQAGSYPLKPAPTGTIGADDLMVVSRSAEEPGHPLENAFDADSSTWFRTVRDQSVAYGPHEFTLSLGGRRVVEGFKIAPRNDKYWKYGQVRNYEVYIADVNGNWGKPIKTGELEQIETEQEVQFPPCAGRLLRFRILSTHDDGADPMVLGANELAGKPYNAFVSVQVGPTTISEFHLLEQSVPDRPEIFISLAKKISEDLQIVRMNGLTFENALLLETGSSINFELSGTLHTFSTEVGIDDNSKGDGPVQFQVWGDGRLLWDSGFVNPQTILKPRLDIRGITNLNLRTLAQDEQTTVGWAETRVFGYEGDTVVSDGINLLR